ncbi:MAG: DUF4855 domain-containing protein [Clostridia bacterium]|nr:DUF4855 domain-containing protein [Clostridia bacterium]
MEIYSQRAPEKVKTPLFWDASETDYCLYQNLIRGLGQTIVSAGEMMIGAEHNNTPESSSKLTDGIFASVPTYTDGAFFKFYRAMERTVFYDIGRISAIHEFCGSFLYEDATGVRPPRIVRVRVSEDADKWQTAAVITGIDRGSEDAVLKIRAKFDAPIKARFVSISFNVDCWCFCDQLEVFGTKTLEGAVDVVPEREESQQFPNRYVFPEDFFGVHDIMLAYNCLYKNPQAGLLTKEMFLPYVAYYNKNGRMSDTFFDSFLFLPFVSAAPSGGFYYDNRQSPGNFSDWQYYVDNTFAPDYNVFALNAAVAEMKAELKLPSDYKVNVFFSILFPTFTQRDFGDVDGSGRSLDFNSIEDRKTAIRWLIDEQLRRFKEADLDELNLLGYYWFHEEVNYSDKTDLELIKYTTDYVRSLGYSTIWIPWYQAPGFQDWKEFGFEVACMQPNYAFTKNPAEVVYANARTTKKLGMCVEIEIGGLSTEAVAKYRMYLKAGAQTGYMNALHMYYQNGGPGEFYNACHSSDKVKNQVYHDTYRFVKHQYPICNIELVSTTFELGGGTIADGRIASKKGEDLIVTLFSAPKTGSVTLSNDGSFKYIAKEGFSDNDRFFVDVTDGLSEKQVFEIIIKA